MATPGVTPDPGLKTLIEILRFGWRLHPEAGPLVRIHTPLEYGRIPLPGATDDPTGKFSQAEREPHVVIEAKSRKVIFLFRPQYCDFYSES